MYFSGETIQSVLQSNGFSCQFCDMVLNSLEQQEQHRIGKIIKMVLLHIYVKKFVLWQVVFYLCIMFNSIPCNSCIPLHGWLFGWFRGV